MVILFNQLLVKFILVFDEVDKREKWIIFTVERVAEKI
jgi:hypothetical protein